MAKRDIEGAGLLASDLGFVGLLREVPTGIPAAVIGTALKGPAFVPITIRTAENLVTSFGNINVSGSISAIPDIKTSYGMLGAKEWLDNAKALTYVRVLGIGDGKKRVDSGTTTGDVTNAGFTVGENQPDYVNSSGSLNANPYANFGGIPGRTYFLGCFMSESAGSTIFSSAKVQGTGSVNNIVSSAVPIIRGILMAPSGVVLRLSSSGGGKNSDKPLSTLVANDASSNGTTLGSVALYDENGKSLQQFTLLLNGHKETKSYPNVITASFDVQSENYIGRVLNQSASLMQNAGHYLAAYWDVHPSTTVLTGVGVVTAGCDNPNNSNQVLGKERSAFLITSSLARDTGSSSVPNYENFRDRFSHASTPWIISQKFHNKYTNLFKFHALDAGSNVANQYKVLIQDIIPAGIDDEYQYSSFSISIRNIKELDDSAPSLEQYINVNLDPASPRYISKLIGDIHAYYDFDRTAGEQKFVVEGNYPTVSRIVRVEVSREVHEQSVPPQVVPMGFRGISHLVTSGSAPFASLSGIDASALSNTNVLRNCITLPLPLADNINILDGNNQLKPSTSKHWGAKFEKITDLNNPNGSGIFNDNFEAITKHFPNHSVNNINFSVSNNEGAPDTTQLGIIDADRFCNNLFTLENIKIVTSSNGFVNPPSNWVYASYVRDGNFAIEDKFKTRPVTVNDLRDNQSRNYLSFYTIFQGGFDGVNIFDVEERSLTNAAVRADMNYSNRGREVGPNVTSYLKALEILNNVAGFDMKILAIPGIRHPVITDEATAVAESRFDAMYVMDIEQVNISGDTIDVSKYIAYNAYARADVTNTAQRFEDRGLNSTFAAAYFPDVILSIPSNVYGIDRVEVPPSVVVLGAISLNDSIGQPWFAPAGVTRGALKSTLKTVGNILENDVNELYGKNINPLYVPQQAGNLNSGVVVWGQKTISRSNSILSRINTRRLLIEIRRQAREVALKLLFNQNLQSTLQTFSSEMNKRLGTIKTLFGLKEFNVKVDLSTTTQKDIDNNTIRGKIYLRPTRTSEFVSLDFIVSNGLESEI